MNFEESDTFRLYKENDYILQEALNPLIALSRMCYKFLTIDIVKSNDIHWNFGHFYFDFSTNKRKIINHEDAMKLGTQACFFENTSEFKKLQFILRYSAEGIYFYFLICANIINNFKGYLKC